jgi:4-carboxymuconolactone decarboxylase
MKTQLAIFALVLYSGVAASSARASDNPPQPAHAAGAATKVSDTPSRSTESKPVPSRAQQLMGDVAPKLAELTDQVLFGDVWQRPGLSKRDRSLVTISALIAMNRPDQLRSHVALGRENGLTQAELSEAITQLAFYAGWPSAVAAVAIVREVYQNKDVQESKK